MSTTVTRAITVRTRHFDEDKRIREAVDGLSVALRDSPGKARALSVSQVRDRITVKVTTEGMV